MTIGGLNGARVKYFDRISDVRFMIPPKIIRFLEERATQGVAGTRDGNLVPTGHRVSGWQVDAAGRTLTAFIRPASEARFIESVQDNGAIAITIGESISHETYQFKGRCMSHRPVQQVDIDMVDRLRDRLVKGLYALFHDERVVPYVKASIPTPSVAVAVEVDEVFVQTPGPEAGSRIAPPDAR